MKNFTERRKDGPKVRAGFENFTNGEAAKLSGRVALVPGKEGFCRAFGGCGSRPELFVYIVRPFFFCLDLVRGGVVPSFFGDEWKFASERISIQPRAPFSGLGRVKQRWG